MTRTHALHLCYPWTQVQASQIWSIFSDQWAISSVYEIKSHWVRLRDKGQQVDHHHHWSRCPSISSSVDIQFCLKLSMVDIWDQRTRHWGRGSCSTLCIVFSSTSNLYPLCAQPFTCVPLFLIPWTSPQCSSVLGISQARILEWAAISYSRGSSWPRDGTQISCIGRHILYPCTTWEALYPLDVCNPHHLYHPTKNISSKCPLEAKYLHVV